VQVQLRLIMNWLKVARDQSALIARRYARLRLLNDLRIDHMASCGRKTEPLQLGREQAVCVLQSTTGNPTLASI
jgi:hypothetical protein